MYYHILRVRAIPTLESTDSMMVNSVRSVLFLVGGTLPFRSVPSTLLSLPTTIGFSKMSFPNQSTLLPLGELGA